MEIRALCVVRRKKKNTVYFTYESSATPLYNRTRRILAYLPSRLNSRYKRVKFVRRTHNYLSPRTARFRNRRNNSLWEEKRLCVSQRTVARRRTRPCLVFIDGLISRNFRDEAPIARDLFTSASRRAFARRRSSAYRMKRAPKLQLKLSVSIRARPRGKGGIARKSRRVIQGYLNEN